MILNKNVLATLVPAMMCSAAIADDFVDIPDVPSSVMRTGGSTVTEDGEAIHNEPVITVKQGNNYIVPVGEILESMPDNEFKAKFIGAYKNKLGKFKLDAGV